MYVSLSVHQDIIEKLYSNPKKIFSLPDQDNTYIEVDMDEEWTIPDETRYCRSKWTPFAGRRVRGCVRKVVLRGEVAYIDGKVSSAVHLLCSLLLVSHQQTSVLITI